MNGRHSIFFVAAAMMFSLLVASANAAPRVVLAEDFGSPS